MAVTILSEQDFRNLLKGSCAGHFFFFGPEDYLKSYAARSAREAVCPDEGLAPFNDVTIDFPDYSAGAFENALAAPPMMAERKFVLLKSFRMSELKPSEAEDFFNVLEKYKDDTSNLTVVSFVPDGLDVGYLPKRPSATLTRLCALGRAVAFDEVSPARLYAWVARHFQSEGLTVSAETARFVVDYCGRSMYTLSLEIGKLAAYVHAAGRQEVTADDVRYVAIPGEDCDSFALSNAVLGGDRREALRVLSVMKTRQVKPEYIFTELSRLYCDLYLVKELMQAGKGKADVAAVLKVHEYKAGLYMAAAQKADIARLARCVTLCADTDLSMKSFGRKGYEPLERLICLL